VFAQASATRKTPMRDEEGQGQHLDGGMVVLETAHGIGEDHHHRHRRHTAEP
jgi:hypothetical protein